MENILKWVLIVGLIYLAVRLVIKLRLHTYIQTGWTWCKNHWPTWLTRPSGGGSSLNWSEILPHLLAITVGITFLLKAIVIYDKLGYVVFSAYFYSLADVVISLTIVGTIIAFYMLVPTTPSLLRTRKIVGWMVVAEIILMLIIWAWNAHITVPAFGRLIPSHQQWLWIGGIVLILILVLLLFSKAGKNILQVLILLLVVVLLGSSALAVMKSLFTIPPPRVDYLTMTFNIRSDSWYRIDWVDDADHWNNREFDRPRPSRMLMVHSSTEPDMTTPCDFILGTNDSWHVPNQNYRQPVWVRWEPIGDQNIQGEATLRYWHHDGG